jgi:hypothetical protein
MLAEDLLDFALEVRDRYAQPFYDFRLACAALAQCAEHELRRIDHFSHEFAVDGKSRLGISDVVEGHASTAGARRYGKPPREMQITRCTPSSRCDPRFKMVYCWEAMSGKWSSNRVLPIDRSDIRDPR